MKKLRMNKSLLRRKGTLAVISVLTFISGCASTSPGNTDGKGSIQVERIGSQQAIIRDVNTHRENGELNIYGSITKTNNRRGHILGHLHIEAYDETSDLISESVTDYRRKHHKSSSSKFSETLDVHPEEVAKIRVLHHGTTASFNPVSNPLSVSKEVVAAGKVTYQENCLSCHGSMGKGDGEDGMKLSRKPADLASFGKTALASDEYLYWMIYEGGDTFDTGMPSFGGYLTNDEIWQVAIYLRQL